MAEILHAVEVRRHDRANALYNALQRAEQAAAEAMRKKEELETFAAELEAANEEMRATNEEMRAANEEARIAQAELEHIHTERERVVAVAPEAFLDPLRTAASHARTVLAQHEAELDATARAHLEYIVSQNVRTTEMLQDLTNYWRVDSEGGPFQSVACEGLLEQVLLALEEPISETEAAITHDSLPVVVADELQLGTLLEQLLDNALKFRRDVPPQTRISAKAVAEAEVQIPEPGIEAGWIFSVRDNGIGIRQEDFESIFLVFRQLQDSGAYPGTGMGLALARGIAIRHAGHLWVESTPGEGSAFHFALPRHEELGAEATCSR